MKSLNYIYNTVPRALEPVQRAAFFGALTNLDNAQSALSNLLIARSRIMYRNKYETNYMHPTCHTSKIRHRKHNTE